MNKAIMVLILICAFLFIAIVFKYLGKKIYLALKTKFKKLNIYFYWPVFISAIFMIFYFKTIFLATLLYAIIFYILADAIKTIFKVFKIDGKIKTILKKANLNGFTSLILSFILTICACLNCKYYQVTDYNIKINKDISGENINIVMISDTHLGISIEESELDLIVDKINALNADVICLGGDIIDESTSIGLEDYAVKCFSRLNSKYGTYYINGNHERSDDRARFGDKLESVGVNVLYDEYVLVNDSFYIIGRNNGIAMMGDSTARTKIEDIMSEMNTDLPIIMLDHDPNSSEENMEAGVDLQLSGHTHNGQLYPFNYIAALANDYGYGHYSIDDYNIVISSGIGTWGFPVRLGSKSEIVNIKLSGV